MGKTKQPEFGVSDEFWERVKRHVPERVNKHSCGGGRKPADPRRVLAAIYFVWRTGCQWRALDATGILPGSTAHANFQRWVKWGVFERLWADALHRQDELKGLDWSFVSIDGCMTKAPLGGEKNRAQPDRPGKAGHQAEPGDRRQRGASGRDRSRGQRE